MGQPARSIPTDADLDKMQWIADADADAAIAAILGPWIPPDSCAAGVVAESAAAASCDPATVERIRRVEALRAIVRTWQDNDGVAAWRPNASQVAIGIGEPLLKYVSAARQLPPWADRARIERAQSMFMDYGALSVTILFCGSLPECYVVPDLAAVLHATGQLVDRTEHRIRTTGAMIFPVMMLGGLHDGKGGGVAQSLKVRLIHAMIRNLILRGSPEEACALLAASTGPGARTIPPLAQIQHEDTMSHALHVLGWDLKACALPNNQEELAYTLLTFSYVFLRGMRRLGIAFTREEEEDYLHAWNVAGHVLGIRRELMVETMKDADELFARMQKRGRADWVRNHAGRVPRPGVTDPRPALGAALMDAMKSVIPDGPFKSFPVLLTRRLIEPASARDLGINERVSWISKVLFAALLGTARFIDWVVRLFFRDFSISRLIARAIGYRLTCALLMSETCELSVPDRLRPGIRTLIESWGKDKKAPNWMNAMEDKLTTKGDWLALDRTRCDKGA